VARATRRLAAAMLALALGAASCERAPENTVAPAAPAPQIAAAPGVEPAVGPMLKAVRERGRIRCGVEADLAGFSWRDVLGQWRGFDVDFCRAVAAAVFGDAGRVRLIPFEGRDRITALQADQVDILPRGGAWTFTRDAGLGLDFAGIVYYDSQGLMGRASRRYNTADDLATARICVQAGTGSELNLVEWLKGTQSKARTVVLDTLDQAVEIYVDGGCEVISADISTLSAIRSRLRTPDQHVILPESISKEPLGPIVRQGDDQWTDIVTWTLNAMILAEELGVSAANVSAERDAPRTPQIARLLSGDGYGPMLSLKDDWAFQVIRQVGSYADVYSRNLGDNTGLALPRGLNALWNAEPPGMLYAPPMR